MQELEHEIQNLIHKHGDGLTGSIPYAQYEALVKDFLELVQAVFDPENQPNQYGIGSVFGEPVKSFGESVEPAIRYLLKNHHPHASILIRYDSAELLESLKSHNLTVEVPD